MSDQGHFDVVALTRTLAEHAVDYVIVGGIAAIAHGYSGVTLDLDAVPALAPENLDRLADALRALDAQHLASNPCDVSTLDASLLRTELVWHFATSAGPLDVLLVIDGPGGYRELARTAESRSLDDVTFLVASLDDLIDAKETAGRAKDLRAVEELRRLRDSRG